MKPRLFEALMQKDNDQKHAYEELKRKSETNPFLKRYVAMGIKEGLFSDSANALGVCMILWLMRLGLNLSAEA